MQLLGVDGNASKILRWEVDCAFFKGWSSMHENEEELKVSSALLVSLSSSSQILSKEEPQFFSILKGFLLSETLREASSTSSPQTTGVPTQCSPQPALPYCLAVTTVRSVLPCHAKLLPWCQASCTDIILLDFPPQISLSVTISAHPQSYFTCLPPFLLEMFCLRVTFQSCGMLPPAPKTNLMA